jgi:2-phosphoglycerate kinase
MQPDNLRERLRHVRWIGGGSGAGKSTIASRVASRNGLQLYSTDKVMPDHARRSSAQDAPSLSLFAAMDMDERWLNRSPETMLETFHWYQGEAFALIIEDLLRLSHEHGVIAEGFRLLPVLVKPLLAASSHAVWLLPTPEFRQHAFASRGGLWQIAEKTSNPPRALSNLLERDRMFTERLRAETTVLGLPVIDVGVELTKDALDEQVTTMLGL